MSKPIDEIPQDERLNKAIKTLRLNRYDIPAMEELFTLEAEELQEFNTDPETFSPSQFMTITRYIFRELNYAMVKLGMYDKEQPDKVRFNQNYIDNCNAITTELLTQSARRDPEAINRLSLILHDYLSPYAHKLKEGTYTTTPFTIKPKEEPKKDVNAVTTKG